MCLLAFVFSTSVCLDSLCFVMFAAFVFVCCSFFVACFAFVSFGGWFLRFVLVGCCFVFRSAYVFVLAPATAFQSRRLETTWPKTIMQQTFWTENWHLLKG